MLLVSAIANAQPGVVVTQQEDGLLVKTPADVLRIIVCGPAVIHVLASPDGSAKGAAPKQPWMVQPCTPSKFTLTMPKAQTPGHPTPEPADAADAILDSGDMQVRISLGNGSLEFTDKQGTRLLQEFPRTPRSYDPVTINGEAMYQVSDHFNPEAREGLYGLGQHQNGVFNYRGTVIELAQANTDVAIPLLLSTKGYGLFWNTAAKSWFDNRYPNEMKFSAEASHAIDYYVIYGPEMDQIIHKYRQMTGHAPLFGEWAYGFFQSKDRYKSADELLQIVDEYRSRDVPLDTIVQDWFWWTVQGDPEFRSAAYADVPGLLSKLHAEHAHAMLSAWAVFDPKSKNYQELLARGLTIPGTTDYDPTNPAAGAFYWDHFIGKEFANGWDAFWLDSSEPEAGYENGHSDAVLFRKQLYIGNGALYTNVFPLMHTGNVYTHWRDTTDKKRVFLLTRSGFAGQQRYGAATWSGDVLSTFQAFNRQLSAGLNFALSGMPYWTTDIAGYGPPYARDTHDPAYQELYTRWFQFGAFCPLFRTHGHRANDENELFSYGPVTPILVNYDKLRYRLLPYIYSLAWEVTSSDGTIMRPLVMDWRTDERVWNIGDQFMFGAAILVNPVTQEGARSRWLYLPPASGWYDFWTGIKTAGSQRIEASAPLERIPLYVKAGSILPLGPVVEYAGEKPDAPIDLRVYRGADGSFNLYEDAGDTYAYEGGMHTLIPIHWDEAAGKLTLGARLGNFPGMTMEHKFRVIFVAANHGAGTEEAPISDREVTYDGQPVTVTAP